MDELIKPACIKRLKTSVLLGMWQEYASALRSLHPGDPLSSELRKKLDRALDEIELQLQTRGINRERSGMESGMTVPAA